MEPMILNGHNYVVWVQDMEIFMKIKALWKYKKALIPYPNVDQTKFSIDGKDGVVGFITTYISREIHFHTSKIDYTHQV